MKNLKELIDFKSIIHQTIKIQSNKNPMKRLYKHWLAVLKTGQNPPPKGDGVKIVFSTEDPQKQHTCGCRHKG